MSTPEQVDSNLRQLRFRLVPKLITEVRSHLLLIPISHVSLTVVIGTQMMMF